MGENNVCYGDSFVDYEIKRMIRIGRYIRFAKWLDENDFDRLMYRLLLEHGKEYFEKCYLSGIEPCPNNKLDFILKYLIDNYASVLVKGIETSISNEVWLFKGYYFQIIFKGGIRIYNKEDMRLLLKL